MLQNITKEPPNPALQQTASRARSFGFEKLFLARSRQLNANPLGGCMPCRYEHM